jgi:hypothetical protein
MAAVNGTLRALKLSGDKLPSTAIVNDLNVEILFDDP